MPLQLFSKKEKSEKMDPQVTAKYEVMEVIGR
jgi:hypothetical protein